LRSDLLRLYTAELAAPTLRPDHLSSDPDGTLEQLLDRNSSGNLATEMSPIPSATAAKSLVASATS